MFSKHQLVTTRRRQLGEALACDTVRCESGNTDEWQTFGWQLWFLLGWKPYCTSLWSAIMPAAFSADVLNTRSGGWAWTPCCTSTRCRWSCHSVLPFQDLSVDMTWWKTSLLATVTDVCDYHCQQLSDSAHPFYRTKIPKWHFTCPCPWCSPVHGSWKNSGLIKNSLARIVTF